MMNIKKKLLLLAIVAGMGLGISQKIEAVQWHAIGMVDLGVIAGTFVTCANLHELYNASDKTHMDYLKTAGMALGMIACAVGWGIMRPILTSK